MGILTENALLRQVALARAGGLGVVMTNGCFDHLHPGHLHTLEAARELGDRLIVAVNCDATVRRLKGVGRPDQPLEVRMTALDALGWVDWVVPFSEPTPARLVAAVLPDVLVKGGDYRLDEVVGKETVTARGGRVVIVEQLPGWSTTALLQGHACGDVTA